MVAQIINSGNTINRTTNTLSGKREGETIVNEIINRDNGTNDSTNVIHNEAKTIYATNKIINIYEAPACWGPPAPPFCGSPWGFPPPLPIFWNPWSLGFGMFNWFFPPIFWCPMFSPFGMCGIW